MNPELLLDIAKLVRKYPPEVWDEFFHYLRSPDVRERILTFVDELNRLSSQSRVDFRRENDITEEVLFRRAVLLDQIREDLRKRRLSELREYAESLGASFPRDMSKAAL